MDFFREKWVYVTGVVVLILLSFVPFSSTIIPEWHLRVVDSSGKTCTGEMVTEYWKHSSLDYPEYGGREVKFSDDYGFVGFSERRVSASLAKRIVLPPLRALGQLAHMGGWGINGSVYATGIVTPDHSWALIYNSAEAMPDVIVVDECTDKPNSMD